MKFRAIMRLRAVSRRWSVPSFTFICVSFILTADGQHASAQPGAVELYPIKAPTGPARRWSAGMGVTPFSQVDLYTGRVHTALPIVGWGGRGPGISLALHHHMISDWEEPTEALRRGDANLDGKVDTSDLSPFVGIVLADAPTEAEKAVADMNEDDELDLQDLDEFVALLAAKEGGPVWTHTYDTSLKISGGVGGPDTVVVVWGDGTKDRFSRNISTGQWDAMPGVFNRLEPIGSSPITGWKLTTRSQSKLYFHTDGLLDFIEDPSGNQVVCTYIDNASDPADGELDYITDASGRVLDFSYNSHGKLAEITAPLGVTNNPSLGNNAERVWLLLYEDTSNPGNPHTDGDGHFVALEDPLGHRIHWDYTADYDIDTIADQNGKVYDHDYDGLMGRLSRVTNPLAQEVHIDYGIGSSSFEQETVFTDVRGNDWFFLFDVLTFNLIQATDPLSETTTIGHVTSPANLVHEVATVTNPLGKTWTSTHDSNGNVLTTTDPLGNKTTYGYDTGGMNNLVKIIPPGTTPGTGNTAKAVAIEYNDANHPTSPTHLIEPADGQGNGTATTVIAYYDDDATGSGIDPEDWNGLVKSVTDPNGVVTLFTYDAWGQTARETENPVDSQYDIKPAWPMVFQGRTLNEGGAVVGSSSSARRKPNCTGCGPDTATYCTDNAGQQICAQCPTTCVSFCPIEPTGINATLMAGCATSSYSPTGSSLTSNRCVNDPLMDTPYDSSDRNRSFSYDDLDRPLTCSLATEEPVNLPNAAGTPVTRTFTNNYDDASGVYTATDQDGDSVITELDAAGRVWRVTRSVGESPNTRTIVVESTYDAAGRMTQVDQGNG
ncbi:MAG: RHS repeat protein, partial [Phycisphaerae bacterium]|nr:RHS repeat protein [Phycisphaerae bacterium]